MPLTPWDILLAVGIFVIAFFSVVSGGVGLLTRPLLIFFGYPPQIAIGTFRVANMFSRLGGLLPFAQNPNFNVDWKLALLLFIPSLIGGAIGAVIVAYLSAAVIKIVLAVAVMFFGVLLIVKREYGLVDAHTVPTRFRNTVGFIAAIFIGICAAFVGGSGILFNFLLLFNYQKTYLSSAPIRKITNLGSALSASIIFIYQGLVDWKLMVLVLIADGLGEYFGSKYQMQKGEQWERNLTIAIIFICGIALLFY